MARDIKFTQDSLGKWHIDFASGDFEMTDGLDTALYISVFAEKRANAGQVPYASSRRGHFTNEFSRVENYEKGSLFWLYSSQAKNTERNTQLMQDAVKEGCSWMTADGILSKVDVKTIKTGSSVNLDIELTNNQSSKYYNLLVNTFS